MSARKRKSAMGRKLQAIADGPLINDLHINAWLTDKEGEPRPEPGRLVPIAYHRADGGRPLKGQRP